MPLPGSIACYVGHLPVGSMGSILANSRLFKSCDIERGRTDIGPFETYLRTGKLLSYQTACCLWKSSGCFVRHECS